MENLRTQQAYAALTGRWPFRMPVQSCRNKVVELWDGRKFDGKPFLEMVARGALCEIALAWTESEEVPYDLTLITERLREMHSAFGADVITLERVRNLYTYDLENPVQT